MNPSKRFWNLFAKFYSRSAISDPDAYRYKLDRTQEYFSKESVVLEFGCGTGSTALIHAPYVRSILGIDYSRRMIEIANQKVLESDLKNVEFRESTLLDLKSSQAFDAILGLNVLHLIDEMDETIAKCFELLKPGGIFVSSTACLKENLSFALKTILPLGSAIGLVPRVQTVSVSEFEKKITEVGFEILESSAPGKDKNVVFIIAKKS